MMRGFTALFPLMALAAVAPAQDRALKRPVEESRQVALQVLEDLRKQLLKEMELSGPLRSLVVCKHACPEITMAASRKTGWRIAAVSLKPRNAGLGTADAWEQRVLADFERRVAKGEPAAALELADVVREPQGRFFRYAKAIAVENVCLTCHGGKETLPPSVSARLAIDYPFDKATGFKAGQLYGIVSIKREY